MIVPQITDILRTAISGMTIYDDFLPAQPDTCVCVKSYAGQQSTDTHYDTISIQVISRSPSYTTANTNITSTYQTINLRSTDVIVDIFANHPPYFAGRDDLNRYTFIQNYTVHYKR